MDTRTLYFKVVHGFKNDDFISITQEDLESALFAHITGRKIIFSNGSISGTMIQKVVPDFHKTMGWNVAHQLTSEDWIDIKRSGIERQFNDRLIEAKNKVAQLQRNAIGTNALTLDQK